MSMDAEVMGAKSWAWVVGPRTLATDYGARARWQDGEDLVVEAECSPIGVISVQYSWPREPNPPRKVRAPLEDVLA